MGASGWDYLVPYEPDIAKALLDLQRQVHASNEYYEGTDAQTKRLIQDDDPVVAQALAALRRTTEDLRSLTENVVSYHDLSFDELVALRDTEEFWDDGTHSILDIERIVDVDQPDTAGAIRALTADETIDLLGTERPNRSDFERVRPTLYNSYNFPRWSGRYVILYEDGEPHEIAFWGFSGD